MSCSTGAPSACARALGFHDARNGTAVSAAPAMPVTVVATSRKWRRPPSTFSTSEVIHDLREASFARARRTQSHTWTQTQGPAVRREVSNVQGIPHYTHID